MKNLKKLILAGLLFLLPLFFLFVFNPSKALAAPNQDEVTTCFNSMRFIDIAHIACDLPGQSSPVIFTDIDPLDASGLGGRQNYRAPPGIFCDVPDSSDDPAITISLTRKWELSDAGKGFKGYVDLGYIKTGESGCNRYDAVGATGKHTHDVADTDNLAITLKGGSDSASSLDGVTRGGLANWNFTRYDNGNSDPSNDVALLGSGVDLSPSSCKGSLLAVSANGETAVKYDIKSKADGFSGDLVQLPDNTGCGADKNNFGLGDGEMKLSPAASITQKEPAVDCSKVGEGTTPDQADRQREACEQANQTNTGGPNSNPTLAQLLEGGGDSSACVANSSTTLEWILCPIINAISKFTDQMNNFVEAQLHFRVGQLLPNDGQVNKAWTIIKNIVAGLVVILMLVMVISQAVGGQFFDAYTVKKMLPKLVIAVIAMQFSWVIGKWMIGIANDLGEGLKQIMLAPFGGGGNMDLPSIMHHLNGTYPAVTTAAIFGIILVMIFTFREFILPILLFVALAVGSALAIALATLVFRNILIIMAIIFAPLALLLWATPGQTMQGYWKKYADNFGKLLLFFPLVIALIYTGRIAAWLAGGLGAPSLIEYFIVLVAFFGPYFFLPKTFRWGGQLLGAISQGINQNKALNMAKGFLQGGIKEIYGEARLERTKDLSKSAPFLARDTSKSNRWYRNPFRLTGNLPNLLPSGRVRARGPGFRRLTQEGMQWKNTTDERNIEGGKRPWERARRREESSGGFLRNWANRGKWGFASFRKGKDMPYDQSAGAMAMLGYLDNGEEPRWQKAIVKAWFGNAGDTAINNYARVPLGASTYKKLYRDRKRWEKKYGKLFGGLANEYDPRTGSGDSRMETRMRALEGIQNRTPQQETELKELIGLNALRQANWGKKPTRAQLKNANKNLENAQERYKIYIEEPDADSPFANTDEDRQREETAQFIPFVYHPAVQEEATNLGGQVAQAIKRDAPDANSDVLSHWARRGFRPTLDVDSAPDGEHTYTDDIMAFFDDYRGLENDASSHEAAEKEKAIKYVEAKRKGDVGKVPEGEGLQKDARQFPSDKRIYKLLQAVKEGDTRVISFLTAKTGTSSTALPFLIQTTDGTLNPGDLFRGDGFDPGVGSVLEQIQAHPWKAEPYGKMAARKWEMRRDMGFEDDNVALDKPRDVLIAITAHAWQTYDPTWTPAEVTKVFDEMLDPEPEHQRQFIQATDEHGNAISFSDPAVRARLQTHGVDLAPPPPRPTVSPTALRHMQERYGMRAKVPLSSLPRAPIADTTQARANAAQTVYNSLSGGFGGNLPPQVIAAIEQAHNSFNDPQYAKDPAKPVGFGNYTDRALAAKRKIITDAVTQVIPDKVFARKFGSELIARGIAGEATADSGADELSQLETQLKAAMAQRNSGDSKQWETTVRKMLEVQSRIDQLKGQEGITAQIGKLYSGLEASAQAVPATPVAAPAAPAYAPAPTPARPAPPLPPTAAPAVATAYREDYQNLRTAGLTHEEAHQIAEGSSIIRVARPAAAPAPAQAQSSAPPQASSTSRGQLPPMPAAGPVAGGMPAGTPIIQPVQPPVTNVTNVTYQMNPKTASSTTGDGVRLRGGPAVAEGFTRIPHAASTYDRPGSAETRWQQQQIAEAQIRHALEDSLKPLAEQIRKNAGGNYSESAAQAARRIAEQGRGSTPKA